MSHSMSEPIQKQLPPDIAGTPDPGQSRLIERGYGMFIRFDRQHHAEKLRLRITRASAPPSIHMVTVSCHHVL